MPVKTIWAQILLAQHIVEHETTSCCKMPAAFAVGCRCAGCIPIPIEHAYVGGRSARHWLRIAGNRPLTGKEHLSPFRLRVFTKSVGNGKGPHEHLRINHLHAIQEIQSEGH